MVVKKNNEISTQRYNANQEREKYEKRKTERSPELLKRKRPAKREIEKTTGWGWERID